MGYDVGSIQVKWLELSEFLNKKKNEVYKMFCLNNIICKRHFYI